MVYAKAGSPVSTKPWPEKPGSVKHWCSVSAVSMRVGGAQDLLNTGASLPQIMVKGGWAKTDTVMRYVERSSLSALNFYKSR